MWWWKCRCVCDKVRGGISPADPAANLAPSPKHMWPDKEKESCELRDVLLAYLLCSSAATGSTTCWLVGIWVVVLVGGEFQWDPELRPAGPSACIKSVPPPTSATDPNGKHILCTPREVAGICTAAGTGHVSRRGRPFADPFVLASRRKRA